MRQKNVLLIMAATAGLAVAQEDPPGRAARLNYLTGAVSFQPAGVTDWVDATPNRPMTTGDHLWVGDGARAELHIGSTAIRLNSDTALQILNLDDNIAQLSLSEGTITVRLKYLPDGQSYEVDTPNLAFTLLQPGEYRIDANPNNQMTTVTAWNGTGEVTGGGQALTVRPREQVVITGDQPITYNVQGLPQPDTWDNWCLGLDRRADNSMAARYVSPEVTGYEDLDANGRWSNTPDYGQVWYPVGVAAGWAPYQNGHWVWVAPWGWTWVDDMPWGFAPFHYGRWAYVGGAWGWIPGPIAVRPVYAPALVAWVGGGGSGFSFGFSFGTAPAVAWFPLGPREPFFPSYHVSQGYFNNVNVSNTVINKTVINNYYNTTVVNNTRNVTNITYVNQRISGAVTAVPQSNFASGRSVQQMAAVVPPAQAQRIGVMNAPPAIAPTRTSVLGLHAATAASAPRPPSSIIDRPVVAKASPPPPPVPFAKQQSFLSQNPGRPLTPTALQQIRQSAPVVQPAVRLATSVATGAKPAPQVNPNRPPQAPSTSILAKPQIPPAKSPWPNDKNKPPAARQATGAEQQRPASMPPAYKPPATQESPAKPQIPPAKSPWPNDENKPPAARQATGAEQQRPASMPPAYRPPAAQEPPSKPPAIQERPAPSYKPPAQVRPASPPPSEHVQPTERPPTEHVNPASKPASDEHKAAKPPKEEKEKKPEK